MRKLALLATLSLVATTPALAEPLRVLANETAPFFYRDDAGEPTGLEYEILESFARKAGRPLEIRWADSWGEVLPAIERGEADIGAALITITEQRRQVMDFSPSYLPIRVMLVEPAERTIQELSELSGETLVTIRGTTYEEALSAVPEAQFLYVANDDEQLQAVASGAARAAAVDSAVAFSHLPSYPGLHLTLPLSERQHLGFALPKGSPVAGELGRHIAQLKSGHIYFRLLEKHLGVEAARAVIDSGV
jgi:ABC-type amino acid transport substrate-binding protein